MAKTAVVVPNWNGKTSIGSCLDSLLAQSIEARIIVVENGSKDGSLEFIQEKYPEVELVVNRKNLGFAGGVNSGIKKALELGFEYIALFNNDAIADKNWLSGLIKCLDNNKTVGIATCKFISTDNKTLDSTGDLYTNWGLPYPRGRGEVADNKYDEQINVFGASGGASIYRKNLFDEIGYFDNDFFAYYEDVDISFRAQLAGWKVMYVPDSKAYHQIGATSGKIKGFTTYHTMKNLPWLYIKNVPRKYLISIGMRFSLAYFMFFISAITRGEEWPAIKGSVLSFLYLPSKLLQRRKIQLSAKVTPDYIWSIITHDLPPNATKLRALRSKLH